MATTNTHIKDPSSRLLRRRGLVLNLNSRNCNCNRLWNVLNLAIVHLLLCMIRRRGREGLGRRCGGLHGSQLRMARNSWVLYTGRRGSKILLDTK